MTIKIYHYTAYVVSLARTGTHTGRGRNDLDVITSKFLNFLFTVREHSADVMTQIGKIDSVL